MKHVILQIVIPVLFVVMTIPAQAASSQAAEQSVLEPEKIIAFAKKMEKTLASKGVRVAIVSRVGRPENELPPGFKYTHTGFAVYSKIKTADGRYIPGYAMYNLYQDAEQIDRSSLITDFPVDFYSGVFELRSGIIIPTPEVQKRLLNVIASDTYKNLHFPEYSAVASPFNKEYQNCTEHVLDVVNAAVYKTDNIDLLKVNAREYFKPQPLKMNPLKIFIGSIMNKDVTLSDHDNGRVSTATFTTIAQYMEEYGLVKEQLVIK